MADSRHSTQSSDHFTRLAYKGLLQNVIGIQDRTEAWPQGGFFTPTSSDVMHLLEDLEDYLRNKPELEEKTKKQYRCTMLQFIAATGCTQRGQLNDGSMLKFYDHCQAKIAAGVWSPHTFCQKVSYLMAYANHRAKVCRDAGCEFLTIKRPVAVNKAPRALHLDGINALLETAAAWPGVVGDVPAGQWWGSLVQWFWCTGERWGATMTGVRLANIRGNIIIVNGEFRKGKKTASYTLPDDLIVKMRAVQVRGEDNVWHWPHRHREFYVYWKQIYTSAGLEYIKYKTGPHQLRKSHASYVKLNGGDATESLLHSSKLVTDAHYIDPTIAPRKDFHSFLPQVG